MYDSPILCCQTFYSAVINVVHLKTTKKCCYRLFIFGKITKMIAIEDMVQCGSPLINFCFTYNRD
jgi:hypothetical protein